MIGKHCFVRTNMLLENYSLDWIGNVRLICGLWWRVRAHGPARKRPNKGTHEVDSESEWEANFQAMEEDAISSHSRGTADSHGSGRSEPSAGYLSSIAHYATPARQ